ncbi:predicted protein [Uncinocarpus reesii 1704]|uniref:Uncharacterized protein n=1 Tax=Uncinocarpus reesii (strain UAMH 1704) TaxID=336963 RepID=C4JDC1_UNCRE|nr:uncharacterized protein UREG_00681 [Uncinocarpus reesii 1704]EEP75834.1 predicted protein [Uncinocarpus reesii 1704]
MGSYDPEPLNCFALLTNKIPTWISRVSDLAAHTAAKQEEFKTDYLKYSIQDQRCRRKKGSSLHTHKNDDERSSRLGMTLDPDDPCADPLTRMKILKPSPGDVNTRKRPPARRESNDTLYSDEGTDRAVRPCHRFLIHYDCHTQSVLEKLVREIGGARNHIRKGRMSAMMKTGFGRKATQAEPSPEDDLLKPIFRSTRQFAKTNGAKQSPFDVGDTYLESAQALCEMASHQFLRNGDCSLELNKTKEKLDLALAMAKEEVDRLAEEAKSEEKAEAEAKARREEKERQAQQLVSEQKIEGKDVDDHNAIEVDDASDTSSISIDLTAFRSSRFRR